MGEYILLAVLIVLLIGMFIASYVKRKKYNASLAQLRDELKKGDKVLTDSGIVGEVVSSYEEEGYKYFVLRSGKGENVGYFTVHGNAIYYVFGKDQPQTSKKAEKQPKQADVKETKEEADVKETAKNKEKTE